MIDYTKKFMQICTCLIANIDVIIIFWNHFMKLFIIILKYLPKKYKY